MKVLIIPDSFKNSISSEEYCHIAKKAIVSKFPTARVHCFPMADGGENTAMVISQYKHFPSEVYTTTGTDNTEISVHVTVLGKGEAFIESALIVGLNMPTTQSIPLEQRSTAGIGVLIRQLYNDGYRKLYIGLGGSGTNDGGYGLLEALGVTFEYAVSQADLSQMAYIDKIDKIKSADFGEWFKNMPNLQLYALTDVENPLLGNTGATAVFGEQKGVTKESFDRFENALANLHQICTKARNENFNLIPGAGAAGGLGYTLCHLNAKIISGADYLIDLYDIKNELRNASLVITGEGRSDSQTLFGKLPYKISKLCSPKHIPCVLISGGIIPEDYQRLNEAFTACFDICSQPMKLEEAVAYTPDNLKNVVQSVVALFQNKNEP